MNLVSLRRIFETQMSPKTWMRTVYFQRYLKLDILARLGVVYLTYFKRTFLEVIKYVLRIENQGPRLGATGPREYLKVLNCFKCNKKCA